MVPHDAAHRLLLLDEQDRAATPEVRRSDRLRGSCDDPCLDEGKVDREDTPVAHGTGHIDSAVALLDGGIDRREAETAPILRFLRRKERLKDVRHVLRGDTLTGIGDTQQEVLSGREGSAVSRQRGIEGNRLGRQSDDPTVRHRVSGVEYEVEHDLLQPRSISTDHRPPGTWKEVKIDILREKPFDHRSLVLKNLISDDILLPKLLDPAEREKLSRQDRGTACGCENAFDVFPNRSKLRMGGNVVQGEAGIPHDHRHEIIEIVGQAPDIRPIASMRWACASWESICRRACSFWSRTVVSLSTHTVVSPSRIEAETSIIRSGWCPGFHAKAPAPFSTDWRTVSGNSSSTGSAAASSTPRIDVARSLA
jgi:hypothetical protein